MVGSQQIIVQNNAMIWIKTKVLFLVIRMISTDKQQGKGNPRVNLQSGLINLQAMAIHLLEDIITDPDLLIKIELQ